MMRSHREAKQKAPHSPRKHPSRIPRTRTSCPIFGRDDLNTRPMMEPTAHAVTGSGNLGVSFGGPVR
jgi:hypothetical protein